MHLSKRASHLFTINDPHERPEPWKTRANIIHFPEDKLEQQVCFQENYVSHVQDTHVHYESDTGEGSSGSPVINNNMELIAVHQSSCMVIERELMNFIEDLFSRLNLIYTDRVSTYYAGFISDPELKIYFKGPNKGNCIGQKYVKGKYKGIKDFNLIQLIHQYGPDHVAKEAPRRWAYEFLKEKGIKIDKRHIFCNTGIDFMSIIKVLKIKIRKTKRKL
ncbi:MAG: hypothetical protein HWD61_08005 [Parachlamydiaceae bacterium]|nr:MAG: hypothetical protein HWD61_08005 [Parachlamydiaceae bacterium]